MKLLPIIPIVIRVNQVKPIDIVGKREYYNDVIFTRRGE